jgi:hypothetical protein
MWCLFFQKIRWTLQFALLLVIVHSSHLYAGPWLYSSTASPDSANLATKSDIDLLASYGFIKSPVMTWPIAWENIGPQLLTADAKQHIKQVPLPVQLVYFRMLSQYQHATKTTTQTSAYLSGGSNLNPFRTFEYQSRSDFNGGAAVEKQGAQWAAKLAVNYGKYRDMTTNVHLDDSYAYGFLGNWALGVDKMTRWWGPGYSDSIILSANAPPLPTITFQRMRADPFESKWLQWIGPWTFMSSLSVGGNDVPVQHPLIWLLNLSIRPLESLQVSMSKVAFFAGDTRPLNRTMFYNLLTVNDNCNSVYHPDYCKKYSPGTEHADITVNWDWFKIWSIPANVYLQTLFNDTLPEKLRPLRPFSMRFPIPARTAFLAGGSYWFPMHQNLLRVYAEIEYTFQNVYYFWGEREFNIYGYSNYPYVYEGKLLGSPLSGEAEGYTIGGVLDENNGSSDTILVRYLKLNQHNFSTRGYGYAFSRQNVLWASIGRSFVMPHHFGKLSGQLGYLKSLERHASGLKSAPSVSIAWNKRF